MGKIFDCAIHDFASTIHNYCPFCSLEVKDKEIAELKAERDKEQATTRLIVAELSVNLSRLTSALNDDERVERVLCEGSWPMGEYGRREAINDYRADIKKEAGI